MVSHTPGQFHFFLHFPDDLRSDNDIHKLCPRVSCSPLVFFWPSSATIQYFLAFLDVLERAEPYGHFAFGIKLKYCLAAKWQTQTWPVLFEMHRTFFISRNLLFNTFLCSVLVPHTRVYSLSLLCLQLCLILTGSNTPKDMKFPLKYYGCSYNDTSTLKYNCFPT